MPHQIAGDGPYPAFRLQYVPRRAVLFLDGQQVFGGSLGEQILKRLIEFRLVAQSGVGSAAFIEDLQRRAVGHRVHQLVLVDVLAEPLHRLPPGVAFGDQRCAGEGDAGGVGEGFEQVITHVAALRAVRLVHHDQDAFGGVDHAKAFRAWRRRIAA